MTSMPDSADFDFVVIGGGSAGYAAARTAASLGLTTAVVDGAPELGGLCILRGCMPSKTLIESANRALTLRRASEFGLSANPGPPSIPAIRDRKRSLIADFASYRQGQLKTAASPSIAPKLPLSTPTPSLLPPSTAPLPSL